MLKPFAERCSNDEGVEGYVWELQVDDELTAEALGVKMTPLIVVFREGEREFDIVAQSASALHYGLLDLGRLVSAREENS